MGFNDYVLDVVHSKDANVKFDGIKLRTELIPVINSYLFSFSYNGISIGAAFSTLQSTELRQNPNERIIFNHTFSMTIENNLLLSCVVY